MLTNLKVTLLKNIFENLNIKVYPDRAKAKAKKKICSMNSSCTHWSESDFAWKDRVDSNERTQTKRNKSKIAFAFVFASCMWTFTCDVNMTVVPLESVHVCNAFEAKAIEPALCEKRYEIKSLEIVKSLFSSWGKGSPCNWSHNSTMQSFLAIW